MQCIFGYFNLNQVGKHSNAQFKICLMHICVYASDYLRTTYSYSNKYANMISRNVSFGTKRHKYDSSEAEELYYLLKVN